MELACLTPSETMFRQSSPVSEPCPLPDLAMQSQPGPNPPRGLAAGQLRDGLIGTWYLTSGVGLAGLR